MARNPATLESRRPRLWDISLACGMASALLLLVTAGSETHDSVLLGPALVAAVLFLPLLLVLTPALLLRVVRSPDYDYDFAPIAVALVPACIPVLAYIGVVFFN